MYEDFRMVAGVITGQALAIIVIDLTGLLWGSNNRMWSKYPHFIYLSILPSIHPLQRGRCRVGTGDATGRDTQSFPYLQYGPTTGLLLDSGRFVSPVDRSGLLLRCQVILSGSLYLPLLYGVPWVTYETEQNRTVRHAVLLLTLDGY